MDHSPEVLDLSIVFTLPLPDSPPETLAYITLQCDALGLKHIGEVFTDPLTEAEREDLRWYLEEYWQWPYLEFAERGKRVEALLDEVGKRFYHALFGSREAQNIAQVWQQHANVQYQISIVSEHARILRLPWELIADSQGFLVLHADHPISLVRRLPTRDEQASSLTTPFQPPLRVLLITARPEEAGFVDPRNISRELVDVLQRQTEAGTIELEFLRPPTFAALKARLKDTEHPIHVLHFDGHGGLDQKAQQGVLLFETEKGKPSPVIAGHLAKVLKNSGVRLAILTACQSAMNTEDNAFSSVSTQLINNGVDAVIAMSSSILVTSAALYVEAFYRALAEGLPVSIAQEQARQALQRDPHRHLFHRHQDKEAVPVTLSDWWLPHFYQQRLLALSPATSRTICKSQPPKSLLPRWNQEMPAEPRYGFTGRSHELLIIERHLFHDKLVAISGFGGIGKTALCRETADWLIRTNLYSCACFLSFEHGNSASTLLSALGHLLDCYDGQYNPNDTDAALIRLRSAIKTRRPLIIADNLESILPHGNAPLLTEERMRLWDVLLALSKTGAGVLLTSRGADFGDGRLAPSHTIAHLSLDGLWPKDAYTLAIQLLTDLGIDRVHTPYSELRTLLKSLDHHPLAIQLVLPALRHCTLDRIRSDFDALLSHFADDHATGRNRSLQASLDYSLACLTPEQRALLPLLAPFESGASENNLLAITEIPQAAWVPLCAALEQAALLTSEHIHGLIFPFLHFHPILTPFLRAQSSPQQDEELSLRYARRYYALADYLYQEDSRHPQAVRMLFQRELPNLRSALTFLLDIGEPDDASNIAYKIAQLLNSLGLTHERDEIRKQVKRAVQSSAEYPLTRVEFLQEIGLGEDEYQRGHLQAAAARFSRLLTRFTAQPAGNEMGQDSFEYCRTLNGLARCFNDAGQTDEAELLLRQELEIIEAQSAKNTIFIRLRVACLADLGELLRDQGRYQQSQESYEEALDIVYRLGDVRNQTVILAQLGTLALARRAYKAARERYRDALALDHLSGDTAGEASTWYQLGMVADEQEQWQEAENCYRRSLELKESIGDMVGAASTCDRLARVAQYSGRLVEAEGWFQQALEICEQEQPNGLLHANILNNLASFLLTSVQTGQVPQARLSAAKHYAERALKVSQQLDSVQIWNTWGILAEIAKEQEQSDDAAEYRRYEHETFAAFPGNRYHIDRQFGKGIVAIAKAARGDQQARATVEAELPELEQAGWHISDATRHLWSGERNWHALAEGLDKEDALLLLRVLETIEGEQGID